MLDNEKGKIIKVNNKKIDTRKFKVCPYKYTRTDFQETGKTLTSYDGQPDDYNERFCVWGKGSWCKYCSHYSQAKISQLKWNYMFNRIKREGNASWLFKNRINVVTPKLSDLSKTKSHPKQLMQKRRPWWVEIAKRIGDFID